MTLIRTVIAPFGIIQASDSNLSRKQVDLFGRRIVSPAGEVKKVFALGFANAAVAVCGPYRVGRIGMDRWMPRFIRTYARTNTPTLRGFAERLKTELEPLLGLGNDCLYHIAGYAWQDGSWRPQMWFVTNVGGIDNSTGNYVGPRQWKAADEFANVPKEAIGASYS